MVIEASISAFRVTGSVPTNLGPTICQIIRKRTLIANILTNLSTISSVMVASLEPSSDGVLSASVVLDYGGEEAGLEPWMLITEVNDQVVSNSEDFSNVMNETYAGQVVNVSGSRTLLAPRAIQAS